MAHRLPLFCLNTVLFPGMRLPLHVFEDRYRQLVHDTLEAPEPRRAFGVVAIREGYEVGTRGVQSAHRVGCEALIVRAESLPGGRYDLEVRGRRRFRVEAIDAGGAYLVGEVMHLGEAAGEEPREAATRAAAAFASYRRDLATHRGARGEAAAAQLLAELPRDPQSLSYFLASTVVLSLPQRQALLEASDATTRLRLLMRALRVERAAMRAVPSVPATQVARASWSPN